MFKYFTNYEGNEEVYAVVPYLRHSYTMGYEYAIVGGRFEIPPGDGWEYPPDEQTDNGVFLGVTWRRREEYALAEANQS